MDNAHAIDLPEHLDWLNCDHPLSLHRDLFGHVVVLVFWHFTDVHSRQVLSDVAMLAHRFADRQVAFVAVHSPKCDAERDEMRVRDAVAELDIRIPVLLDPDREAWDSWSGAAWPTLVVIDAEGMVRFQGAGAADRYRLGYAIDAMLEEGADSGVLAFEPWLAEPWEVPEYHELAWPSALAVDSERGVLWIADTGHHRVLGVALEEDSVSGACRHVIGSGREGAGDGSWQAATLSSPRGLAVLGDRLLIADTGNHILREVTLADGAVTTVVGVGHAVVDHEGGRYGRSQGIASPTGMCVHENAVWVALTGCHQLWTIDPETWCAVPAAGSGRPAMRDDNATDAHMLQPVSVAPHGNDLVIVDCDAHALRALDMHDRAVRTLVGRDAFSFGDVDGDSESARLQGPTAAISVDADLWIADAENGKLRRLRANGELDTLLDRTAGLIRPVALASRGDRLLVADAGAHCIWVVPTAAPETLTALRIDGVPTVPGWRGGEQLGRPVQLRAHTDARLRVPLPIPAGESVHPDATVRFAAENVAGAVLVLDLEVEAQFEDDTVIADGVAIGESGDGEISVRISAMTCYDFDGACHRQELVLRVPVEVTEDAEATAILEPA